MVKRSILLSSVLAILVIFGITSTVHALSWQTAPIMGHARSTDTGDTVIVTGDTPTYFDINGEEQYYKDVDGNIVLGPTIPHYSMVGDPLYGVGDPSITDFYIDPDTWADHGAFGLHWTDMTTRAHRGSGTGLYS